MAISTVGGGYQFLPPVIRHDPNATSDSMSEGSRAGSAAPAASPTASPVAGTPTLDSTAAHTTTGKHLLRITV